LMPSFHLEVRGRVQGVGYRWYVREKARELRVAGWVKNKSDGNVEIVAVGDAEPLDSFRSAVVRGPSGARVEKVVDLAPIPTDSVGSSFDIVR
jgi:acylphosphatase